MTANPEPESSSIFCRPPKPPLAEKPVPKPRRRLTIGAHDAGKMEEIGRPKEPKLEEEAGKGRAAPPPPLARKAMAYRNGTAALLAPQLPRKVQKMGENAQQDLMVKSGIEAAAKRPKGEQRGEPKLRRSNTTLTASSRPNKMIFESNGPTRAPAPCQRLRIPAPPPPPPVKRIQQRKMENDGQNGKRHWGGKGEKAKAPIAAPHLPQKEHSPIPYLTPFCPTASPEASSSLSPSSAATTGSSLNSPSPPSPPPPLPHIFAQSWPSGGAKGDADKMLEELAKEGGAECRLIASWLSGDGAAENAGQNEEGEKEEKRPRFSLDRLVPPELQESPQSSSNASIWADFSLRRPSPRGQCQGTVFVHWHQEKGRLDFSMEQNGKKSVPPPNFVPNRLSQHSPSPRRQGVTPLEQLVKSHPIWFLPHLDRQAVGHLLRNQPAGVFIVRASSRSIRQSPPQPNTSPNHLNPLKKSRSGAAGPVMALSIRLPISAQNDQEDDHLEHFLLEAVGPGQSVRLEGSPNTFASLPLLLEHYTQPEALQELKCRLRLPEAIARSESIQALQGMALMGQDFWTSSLSTAPASAANSPEAPSSSSAHSPTSASLRSGPLPPPAPPMSTFLLPQFPHRPLQSAYCQSPSPSMATTLDGAPASEDGFESAYGHRHQMMAQMPNAGNGCCCCCAGCPAHQMAPKMQQQQHLYQYQQFPPLRKSHSVQSSFPPQHPPYGQSAGRHPWCQSPGSQSLREGRKLPPPAKQKDGFLRSLFSPSPSRRKQSSSSDWTGAENPLWEEQAEGQIWNGQKRRGQNGNNGQQQSIFARLKGKNNPFRRTNSSALGAKDDWQAATNSNMSPEMLWARQAAFRRTNTDMGGCGMAAALGRMRGAAPNLPNGPLPQLARVLPQPRREMNGPALQAQIAAPPADIRKNNFQKSRWVQSFQQQSPPQHFEAPGLKRIPQRGMADSGGGQQNAAAFRLSKGSQTRSQAMIATVRPQQKMSILTKENREEEPEKLAEGHRPSEYTHLNELKSDGEWEGGRGSLGSKSGDELSVAGTDFNEPWDSNAWENLLDLARFGDTKAEVPLLADEQPKRRICSTSSNGSTWRRSSQSSSTEAEEEESKGGKGKIEGAASEDEMTAAAEEAMAMAMILAGNGALPNSRKKPKTEQWSEGEENDPQLAGTHQNPSLDTLILIEQAAKAANSSRGLQRGRWTRATSSSLIDMTKTARNGRLALVPDRPELEEDGAVPGSSNDYDPFSACSMHHHSHQNGAPTACSSSMDELSHHSRSGSICPSITPVLSPSRLRNASQDHPGEEDPARVIQRYVENLSINDQTVFGATLQRFIECTLLSREQDPYVVVRRVRQFLNGMKNYLIKNGESDLHAVVERQSDRLHADEFLNIDAILESVLNKILLVRIKAQLYRLMILESTRNGELGKLSENLATVRAMNSADLGFPEGTPMPDKTRMEQISKQMRKMQNHYSPLKKLQLLLRALALAVPHLPLLASNELRHQQAQQSNSSILVVSQSFSGARLRSNSGSSSNGSAALKHPPADELIRWLVYLLARSSTINCEIEAWYMWELLPQQVLSTGDAAYFLSILFSAVHVIKHPESIRRLKNVTLPAANHPLPNIADFLGSQSTLHEHEEASSDLLLRVAIPNEQEGSIEYHTFPVLPKMNASKLCRVIAHQFSVSNPEDYGLYLMFDGLETVLSPGEFPHLIRDHMIQSGKAHLFAYKRSEARIAWPKQAIANFTNSGNAPNIAPAHTPLQRNLIAPQIGGKEGR